jgi:hypothetical protein
MCLLIGKIAIKLGAEEAIGFAGLETELRGSKCSFFQLDMGHLSSLSQNEMWSQEYRNLVVSQHFLECR